MTNYIHDYFHDREKRANRHIWLCYDSHNRIQIGRKRVVRQSNKNGYVTCRKMGRMLIEHEEPIDVIGYRSMVTITANSYISSKGGYKRLGKSEEYRSSFCYVTKWIRW